MKKKTTRKKMPMAMVAHLHLQLQEPLPPLLQVLLPEDYHHQHHTPLVAHPHQHLRVVVLVARQHPRSEQEDEPDQSQRANHAAHPSPEVCKRTFKELSH
jgi:hypothetical protein